MFLCVKKVEFFMDLIWRWRKKKKFWRGLNLAISDQNRQIFSTPKFVRIRYTGFPNLKILETILNFLDPAKNGEDMVLYNSQLAN